MADSTSLNDQIVDSVSQTAVMTLGSSPAMAAALLYQSVANAVSNLAANVTLQQQQGATVMVAVASTAAKKIMALS